VDSEGEPPNTDLTFKLLNPLLSQIPLEDANDAVVKMDQGKAHYRFVLVNETNGGDVADEEH
jgi:hypothetical protein